MPEPIQTPVPAADELAAQVLLLAQSRLTADLRFLSSALEHLKPIPVPALDTLFAGDGHRLYYCPETLLRTFRAQQSVPTRALLHVTLHFLLGHPFQRQEMDHRLWNLACDITAEEVIRELEIPSCALPDDAAQDSWRSRLRDACPHLTAEAIYNFLLERQYPADVLAELTQLFSRDSHALWYAAPRPGSRPAPNGQLLPAGEREQNIPCDLKDPAWFGRIDASGGAVFFASGVFYYFLTQQVRELVQGMADAFPGGVLVFDAANRTAVKMIAKTWLKTAKIKDVRAYFAVSDAEHELAPWGKAMQMSSRGYMLGYNDLKDPSVSGFFRFLARIGDNGMKMQIVKIGFGGRQ